MGKAGLEDRRGRRIKEQTPRTPEEEMKIRIAQLEHENYLLRMERDLLKKVREFKWYEGIIVHKVYLSAILDLYDRWIVAYEIGESNNNSLVYNNFNKAVTAYPDAHPIFHSDRGFQYTNQIFHKMLSEAGMTQSMSRVAHCIDNGPMEGFWGILKREEYYGHRFISKDKLVNMIETYIDYYNSRRYQRNLGLLTPMEKHYMAT